MNDEKYWMISYIEKNKEYTILTKRNPRTINKTIVFQEQIAESSILSRKKKLKIFKRFSS